MKRWSALAVLAMALATGCAGSMQRADTPWGPAWGHTKAEAETLAAWALAGGRMAMAELPGATIERLEIQMLEGDPSRLTEGTIGITEMPEGKVFILPHPMAEGSVAHELAHVATLGNPAWRRMPDPILEGIAHHSEALVFERIRAHHDLLVAQADQWCDDWAAVLAGGPDDPYARGVGIKLVRILGPERLYDMALRGEIEPEQLLRAAGMEPARVTTR